MKKVWGEKRLGDVLEVQNGYAFSSKGFNAVKGMPLIRIRSLKLGTENETYFDGGAAFYDIELFAAAMEPQLASMLSIHVVGPPDYSFGFDERPDLLRVIFDTHNFTFPEERRRMTAIINLLYDHEALRRRVAQVVDHIEPGILAQYDLGGPHEKWWGVW